MGGQEKEWMRCFLDDLRAFGINVDQSDDCSPGRGGTAKTAEQGAERLAKWIVAEKVRAGLRHAFVVVVVDSHIQRIVLCN